MQGSQKTLDSFDGEQGTESPRARAEAVSMSCPQSGEEVVYRDLIEKVVDGVNVDEALRRVVGNHGAPGVDGMTVDELALWVASNRQDLVETIRSGNYIPEPVRRKEIPKPNGGVRNLGIPTAKDRLVQQMVAQVLMPIYDPTFSDSSFGFRPGRSAHDAVLQARAYYDEGYTVAVDLDLEKFFDTLDQRRLMDFLRERIKDPVLIRLIKRFLRAGVAMPDGLVSPSESGSPQGGPLSPLLSNIYLDRFDKELESRGLRFCRYADDCMIFVRSQRAGERVCESVTRYLEGELGLKVNREKTKVGSPLNLKFLGFKLSRTRSGAGIAPHPSAIARFKKEVRRITRRHRGISLETMLKELRTYMRGWMGYYGITTSKWRLEDLDKWVRRRVRQFVVKQWKRRGTIAENLIALCPPERRVPMDGEPPTREWADMCWNATRKNLSWWRVSGTRAVSNGLSLKWLKEQGMYFLMDDWEDVRERCFNRRVPEGTPGGVRGRLAN